jgi:hypothetical protein
LSAYQQLSRTLVKARKNGDIAWDFMEDRARYKIGGLEDRYTDESALEDTRWRCEQRLRELDIQSLIDEYFEYLATGGYVGYWAGQPYAVEVWAEKDAVAPTLERWLSGLSINIRVSRGYFSWSFLHEIANELRDALQRHERVAILYVGDLDPTGTDIERHAKESLAQFGLVDRVEFRRVAVTPGQVEQFELPPHPKDAETLAKLKRDPRSKGYTYDYVVELDALIAYAPDEFKRLLLDAVERYHNKEVYRYYREQAQEIAEQSQAIVEEYKQRALQILRDSLAGA